MMESCAPGETFASLAALPAPETTLETAASIRKSNSEERDGGHGLRVETGRQAERSVDGDPASVLGSGAQPTTHRTRWRNA